MKIGFQLPANYCFSRANGIRQEAELKIAGLAALGHEVERLGAWDWVDPSALDVLHFFYGGLPLSGIESVATRLKGRLVFSPIIDSNMSFGLYRIAAALGSVSSHVRTIQGEFRRQALCADVVVVRSTHERERVVRGLGIDPAKVRIVRLGVDVDRVDAARVATTAREGVFHLSTYGQPRKNVRRLVEAVGPTGLPLTIAGACDERDHAALRDAAAPYPNVRFAGFLSDAERDDLFYRSRVFVLPSLHEGTGLSALEAAVRGCDVVVTRNGGPPDYFEGLGSLVDPMSVEQIRDAVLRAHAGAAGVARWDEAMHRFSMETSTRALVAAYEGNGSR